MRRLRLACALAACVCSTFLASADENLFGYVRGSETIPAGGWELYSVTTLREGKGSGSYHGWNQVFEVEYGVSDSFNVSAELQMLAVSTSGLSIDGYLPGGEQESLAFSGLELTAKYNVLKPAVDDIGLSLRFGLDHSWKDTHSGEDKDTTSFETDLLLQKYYLDGQMVWVGNAGIEMTYADRGDIATLPPGFDWPTDPEMEVELKLGTGLTYRFAPGWFVGAEALYETEFETEVGQERWSVFAGPTLHYGAQAWWLTFTWLPQLAGGGETYAGQPDGLHLIEKTEVEYRLKLGFNF